jgi:toxin FitB
MNVVDSCGWLEYFGNGANADFFAPAIENVAQLIVPHVVVYEVCKRLRQLYGDAGEAKGASFLEKAQSIGGDLTLMRQAALASKIHGLAMADAIIWQTAQTHRAKLYTQDIDLKGLPGVVFKAKPAAKPPAKPIKKVAK